MTTLTLDDADLVEPPQNYVKKKYLGPGFHGSKYETYIDIDAFGIYTGPEKQISLLYILYSVSVKFGGYYIFFEDRSIKDIQYRSGFNRDIDYLLPDIQKKVLKAVL